MKYGQKEDMGNKASFTWLDLDKAEDCAEYQEVWNGSACKRPHDHPGYLDLVRPDNYVPAAMVYRHAGDARIVYPFFYCEVNSFAPFRNIREPMRHLVSPYGYGGALYEGDPALQDEASQRFESLLCEELRERHFVSEFVREDLFAARLARRAMGEVEQQPNVLVKLDHTPEDVWRTYKHAVRGNVNRAKKSGLHVEFDETGEKLDSFIRIYYETMQRRSATSAYFFPEERFRDLATTLGRHKAMMYAHVYDQDEVVSSELLLLSGDTIYSFLGGSLASAFAKRPNNLLKHEVILWGGRNGYKWLVLGGGLAPGDELFRFKQSFDPNNVVPFCVRRIVHNPSAYSRLVEARQEYERRNGRDWEPGTGFFPQYFSALDGDKDEEEVALLQRSGR